MSDRRQYRARQLRGSPRPVLPEWQLSQREVWAMLSRPHFSRHVVVRIVRQRFAIEGGFVAIRRVVQ